MNKVKRLFACILALSMLVTGVCALADGNWSVNTSTKAMMNDKQAGQALKQAMKGYAGYELKPLALLGTQVVAGTNYCILCYGSTVTLKPKHSLCKVYVYEDPQGKAEIVKIKKIKLRGGPASGWKIGKVKKALAVDKKAKAALKKATTGLAGAEYTPLLMLGKAQNAYSLLCRCKYSDREGTKGLSVVALGKKGGKYVVRRIDDLSVAG